jgi:hypothetical protein
MRLSSDLKLIGEMALSLSSSIADLPYSGQPAGEVIIKWSDLVKLVLLTDGFAEVLLSEMEMDESEALSDIDLPIVFELHPLAWELHFGSTSVTHSSECSHEG